jgi:tRNA (guanine-N7-)-methyltransferase
MDAKEITDVFKKEVSKIYLNFSDPWPKERHAKRRLTSSNFLNSYDNIFKDEKNIEMKTDNRALFEYSLKSFVQYGYNSVYNAIISVDFVFNATSCGNGF